MFFRRRKQLPQLLYLGQGSAATFDDWAAFGGDYWNWENTKG